jgi:hypothetical protein
LAGNQRKKGNGSMGNNYEKAKDNRSDEEVKKDYLYGKKNEKLVAKNLPYTMFKIDNKDTLGFVGTYIPDYFVFIRGLWYPLEIKFTYYPIALVSNGVQLKVNQATQLSKINGLYCQATTECWGMKKAVDFVVSGKAIEADDSYCGHRCYKLDYDSFIWHNWKDQFKQIKWVRKEKK